MKRVVCMIAVFGMLIQKINAQEIPEKDNALMDNFIKSKVNSVKKMLASDALTKVFYGNFYKIDAGYNFTDDMTYCSGDIFVINEGVLSVLGGRMDSMLPLLSMVRKDFYLKNETDAKNFEACLDMIYPVLEMNKDDVTHLKIGNKWYFVRAKFMDSKSAYIVTLDSNSKIVNISYDMEALKQ